MKTFICLFLAALMTAGPAPVVRAEEMPTTEPAAVPVAVIPAPASAPVAPAPAPPPEPLAQFLGPQPIVLAAPPVAPKPELVIAGSAPPYEATAEVNALGEVTKIKLKPFGTVTLADVKMDVLMVLQKKFIPNKYEVIENGAADLVEITLKPGGGGVADDLKIVFDFIVKPENRMLIRSNAVFGFDFDGAPPDNNPLQGTDDNQLFLAEELDQTIPHNLVEDLFGPTKTNGLKEIMGILQGEGKTKKDLEDILKSPGGLLVSATYPVSPMYTPAIWASLSQSQKNILSNMEFKIQVDLILRWDETAPGLVKVEAEQVTFIIVDPDGKITEYDWGEENDNVIVV